MNNTVRFSKTCRYFLLILSLFSLTTAIAAERTVNLVVAYKTVNFTGKPSTAIAVNNQIPAPTLHFKEGDHVTINVYNHLQKGTAIHWHGLLVPWQMDGVEGISQTAIPPGGVFHYQFTLKQAGTYWYHAHAGFQEQQGVYGGLVIAPLHPPRYHYTKDYVVVLSDWSNTQPRKILANLKKEGDYYSPRFPLQPSLRRFIRDYRQATPAQRQKLTADYQMMQQMRMSIYDISDVAYDAFLLNGRPPSHPWTAPVTVGDVVRLRFIGAGGSTIFHVKIPDTTLQLIHVQGNDIKPVTIKDFTVAPGETYDVLVKIRKNAPYIIYAASPDMLGAAYGALLTQPHQAVDYQRVAPFPKPAPVTMMGHSMADMASATSHYAGRQTGGMMHHHALMQDYAATTDNESLTTGTKYQNLQAAVSTNNPNKPVHVINMELSGFMDRYIWFINGVPEYKAKPIVIKPGERYRLVFTNDSMMYHPMHIHGHWLILRNGHGTHDPLLHTIEVPPGATVVADFDADASGQWFFHCHHLYHMMTGMARVFQYSTLAADPSQFAPHAAMNSKQSLIAQPMGHPPGLYLANFLDVGADPFRNIQKVSLKSLWGGDYRKLELFSKDAELNKGTVTNADIDIFYWHLISQFWALKGGVNYFYRPTETPYWQPGIGIEGLMPYFIETDVRSYYHAGSAKLDLELARDTQITSNVLFRISVRGILATKTVTAAEIGSGLNQVSYTLRPYYRLTPNLTLFIEFEHEQDYGVLKSIRRQAGESTEENNLTMGVSLLF